MAKDKQIPDDPKSDGKDERWDAIMSAVKGSSRRNPTALFLEIKRCIAKGMDCLAEADQHFDKASILMDKRDIIISEDITTCENSSDNV